VQTCEEEITEKEGSRTNEKEITNGDPKTITEQNIFATRIRRMERSNEIVICITFCKCKHGLWGRGASRSSQVRALAKHFLAV
jgi:hypothetical protein